MGDGLILGAIAAGCFAILGLISLQERWSRRHVRPRSPEEVEEITAKYNAQARQRNYLAAQEKRRLAPLHELQGVVQESVAHGSMAVGAVAGAVTCWVIVGEENALGETLAMVVFFGVGGGSVVGLLAGVAATWSLKGQIERWWSRYDARFRLDD